MNVSKKSIIKILPFILIVGIVIYIFIDYKSMNHRWNNEKLVKNYTVGKIIAFEELGRGGPPRFIYSFKSNNQEYNSHLSLAKRIGFKNEKHTNNYKIIGDFIKLSPKELEAYIGKRFYVKFIVDYPKYSELLLDRPVPDSVIDIPKGWKDIPE